MKFAHEPVKALAQTCVWGKMVINDTVAQQKGLTGLCHNLRY